MLAAAADGSILRPTLILKRTKPYFLQEDNDIGLWITHSKSGWLDEVNMLVWIEKILIPYVGNNQCLLLMDSYSVHVSTKVLTHLKKYPNIHTGIIVGWTTSFSQPLDISVHKEFKKICRKHSVQYTNRIVKALNEMNHFGGQNEPDQKFLILNNQVILANKDYKKQQRKPTTQALLLQKLTVEDVFKWIREAYLYIKDKPELIIRGFVVAGIITAPLVNNESNEIFPEDNIELVPFTTEEDNEDEEEDSQNQYSEAFEQIQLEEENIILEMMRIQDFHNNYNLTERQSEYQSIEPEEWKNEEEEEFSVKYEY